MRSVVIAGYGRTAFSRARPKEPQKDPFGQFTGEELLAGIVPQLLEKARARAEDIDDFVIGCALGVGEQWTFGGRSTSLLCGLPATVPARFVDMQCGSGMAAIETGCLQIAAGQAEVVVVCGMEHMTRVPVGPTLFEKGLLTVNPKVYRRTADWDMVTGLNMGLTAELLAEQEGLSRAAMDEFAMHSHRRAAAAFERGFLQPEILAVRDSAAVIAELAVDQSLRPETRLEDLAQLQPAFKTDGRITAGNSSPLTSGAAAMVLMSAEAARARGLRPAARILTTASAGVRPELMGQGPVPAARKALQQAGLDVRDVDYWEINEAFSAVVLNAVQQLALANDRVNVHGGALALGHPLGATGIRLVGTLARTLQDRAGRYGCATACVGGGQGIATLIEAC